MGDRNMHKKYLHYTYGFQIEPLSIEEDAEASIVLIEFYIFLAFKQNLFYPLFLFNENSSSMGRPD